MEYKRKLVQEHIKEFLNSISELKCCIGEANDLLLKLCKLNEAYLKLQTCLESVKLKSAAITEESNCNLITFKNKTMKIVYSKEFGVLSVNMGGENINSIMFNRLKAIEINKQQKEIIYFLNLYNSTGNKCVVCGSYVQTHSLEETFLRVEGGGEVLAFHRACYNSFNRGSD